MAFITQEEHMAKIDRIINLEEEGFNVPRFKYINLKSSRKELEQVVLWADKIWIRNSKNQTFNIRTYNYMANIRKELTSCPHVCDVSITMLAAELARLNRDYTCMVDVETPDNGRIAGTIHIPENKESEFTVEFVVKEKRAMVRDVNTDKNIFKLSDKQKNAWKYFQSDGWLMQIVAQDNLQDSSKICKVISYIIREANKFYKKDVIFEWTYFSPAAAGIKAFKPDKNLSFPINQIVWWEYRKF